MKKQGRKGKFIVKTIPLTANSLTDHVVNTILRDGGSASRINVQGQWDEAQQLWRPSGSRKGFGDVAACFRGFGIVIEVKIGDDEQSEDQIEFQQEWEAAGGLYIITKTSSEWNTQWESVWRDICNNRRPEKV